MIPVAYAPLLIESFRRELRALGIDPAVPRTVEPQLQRHGVRQFVARIERWLARRSTDVLPRQTMPGTSVAAGRP
jgi:hypothetical protein